MAWFGGALSAGFVVAGLAVAGLGATASWAKPGARLGADEADMLARARAERSLHAPDASADRGEQIRERAIDAEVVRRVEEAERQAELDAISARIGGRSGTGTGTAAERGAAVQTGSNVPTDRTDYSRVAPQTSPRLGGEVQAEVYASYGAPPSAASTQTVSTRATVLLVMTPGDRGIRRYNPTADPILCIGETCWISRGLMQDAKATRKGKALGALNTLGERAGACNDNTRCVFRNVDLGAPGATVQPVDLRLMRHDRREPLIVEVDRSCQAQGRSIRCGAPLSGADYVMWVVPEAVAAEAGADALASFMMHGQLMPDRRLAGRR